jgi:ABC-type glycerol-3-phosphate transport system permease component
MIDQHQLPRQGDIAMKRIKGSGLRVSDILFHSINYLIFALFAVICIYPFYYIFLYSISSTKEAARGMIYFLPKGLTFSNYYYILNNPGIANAALVSLARTVVGTLITVCCCTLFGYILTKKELPFRKIIYRYVIITMYLNAGLIPSYILMKKIGLYNNFWTYIIPGAVGAFYLILIKTYIEQIPSSIEESAMVDGANYYTVFIRIIFPICTPIIATVAVFTAVAQWNSFADNLIYVNNPKLQTLQMMLYKVLKNVSEAFQNVRTEDMARNLNLVQPTPTTTRMTITMIATLPIIFVYPSLQKYFVKGIMMGAIKG